MNEGSENSYYCTFWNATKNWSKRRAKRSEAVWSETKNVKQKGSKTKGREAEWSEKNNFFLLLQRETTKKAKRSENKRKHWSSFCTSACKNEKKEFRFASFCFEAKQKFKRNRRNLIITENIFKVTGVAGLVKIFEQNCLAGSIKGSIFGFSVQNHALMRHFMSSFVWIRLMFSVCVFFPAQ
jgi:hypothetical protein